MKPTVALLDIGMPKLSDLEAARMIIESGSSTRVLMLSAHSDDAYVDQALALGVAGYLVKHDATELLTKAVLAAGKGDTFFSPSISKRLRERSEKLPVRGGHGKRGKGSRGRNFRERGNGSR
jgi:DNA-binding NarL/FixJ family response regulator